MWQTTVSILRKEKGQGLVELALIISVVALLVVAGLQQLEGGVSGVIHRIGEAIASNKGDNDKGAPKNQVAKNAGSGGDGSVDGGGENGNHIISPDSVLANGVGPSVGSLSVSGKGSNASDNSQQEKQISGGGSRKSLVRGVERSKEIDKVGVAKKEILNKTPKKPRWARVTPAKKSWVKVTPAKKDWVKVTMLTSDMENAAAVKEGLKSDVAYSKKSVIPVIPSIQGKNGHTPVAAKRIVKKKTTRNGSAPKKAVASEKTKLIQTAKATISSTTTSSPSSTNGSTSSKHKEKTSIARLPAEFPESTLNTERKAKKPHYVVPEISSSKKAHDIKANDLLQINVSKEPEISNKEVQVASDGHITFPMIGRIRVEGMTTSQVESQIAGMLRKDYLVNPEVNVLLKKAATMAVTLVGAVKNQGAVTLKKASTVLEALREAGGVNVTEAGQNLTILRTVPGKSGVRIITLNLDRLLKSEDPAVNMALQDKDTVFIPQSDDIFVLGEISRPGMYKLRNKKVSVVEAIAMAGGPKQQAAPNETGIVRVENGKGRVIRADVDSIIQGDESKDVLLRPGDIVVIPQARSIQ